MSTQHPQPGFRKVKPRKQKVTPSRLRREERRLSERAKENRKLLEAVQEERQRDWSNGTRTELAAIRQDDEIAGREATKRVLRREVFNTLPVLEGQPFFKGQPGGRD